MTDRMIGCTRSRFPARLVVPALMSLLWLMACAADVDTREETGDHQAAELPPLISTENVGRLPADERLGIVPASMRFIVTPEFAGLTLSRSDDTLVAVWLASLRGAPSLKALQRFDSRKVGQLVGAAAGHLLFTDSTGVMLEADGGGNRRALDSINPRGVTSPLQPGITWYGVVEGAAACVDSVLYDPNLAHLGRQMPHEQSTDSAPAVDDRKSFRRMYRQPGCTDGSFSSGSRIQLGDCEFSAEGDPGSLQWLLRVRVAGREERYRFPPGLVAMAKDGENLLFARWNDQRVVIEQVSSDALFAFGCRRQDM